MTAKIMNHGYSLLQSYRDMSQKIRETKDRHLIDNVFVCLKIRPEYNVKKIKKQLEILGFKILEYSKADQSVVTTCISKLDWKKLETRITEYAENNADNCLKIIGSFTKRPVTDCIRVGIEDEGKSIDVLISFFSVLKRGEAKAISESIRNSFDISIQSSEIIVLSYGETIFNCVAPVKTIKDIENQYPSVRTIVEDLLVRVQ